MLPEIETLLARPNASAAEKLNSIIKVFSSDALELFLFKYLDSDSGPQWLARAKVLTSLICKIIGLTDEKSLQQAIKFSQFAALVDLREANSSESVKLIVGEYLDNLPGYPQHVKRAAEQHGYLQAIFASAIRGALSDLEDNRAHEKALRSSKPGDVLCEGPGFEVVANKQSTNHIRYADGNLSIMVLHDIREGHFLLVERFNPIKGVYVLEFPRAKGSVSGNQDSVMSCELRDSTGLSFRSFEKIGSVSPDLHIIEGTCDVFYGNFDLEESYEPRLSSVRSLKRITEEGIYQAASEGRIECSLTLSAISIWHAFEGVRKKRVANSNRVRIKREAEEEDD